MKIPAVQTWCAATFFVCSALTIAVSIYTIVILVKNKSFKQLKWQVAWVVIYEVAQLF